MLFSWHHPTVFLKLPLCQGEYLCPPQFIAVDVQVIILGQVEISAREGVVVAEAQFIKFLHGSPKCGPNDPTVIPAVDITVWGKDCPLDFSVAVIFERIRWDSRSQGRLPCARVGIHYFQKLINFHHWKFSADRFGAYGLKSGDIAAFHDAQVREPDILRVVIFNADVVAWGPGPDPSIRHQRSHVPKDLIPVYVHQSDSQTRGTGFDIPQQPRCHKLWGFSPGVLFTMSLSEGTNSALRADLIPATVAGDVAPFFFDWHLGSPPSQLFPAAVAVGVVWGCPAITAGAMPHAILHEWFTGDLVLAVECLVLLGLELVIVEDVQGLFWGSSPCLRDGEKDIGRCLLKLHVIGGGGCSYLHQEGDDGVHRDIIIHVLHLPLG